ncbi:pilus assembly protein [Opitutaceae bacterium TAV4]|nr:pilus assembly protein [Opitutaceae bacterium TAV4]RRK01893.1 pilus assembly protein [Opitutaceae bacterium TAV3]
MPAIPVIQKTSFRSTKGVTIVELLLIGMIVVLVGLMTLPSFTSGHSDAQEKRVIRNLRQLADAAQLHFIRTGDSMVTLDQLVGPGKAISELPSIAGERYPAVIRRDQTEFIATGSTITNKPVIKYSQ